MWEVGQNRPRSGGSITNDIMFHEGTDKNRRCRTDTDEDFKRFSSWRTWLASGDSRSDEDIVPPRDFQLMRHTCHVNNLLHSLIITEAGYIGIAPKDARPGDTVYVLAGGSEAYVLRHLPNAEPCPSFTLVGSCYLHGIMDGEATKTGWQAKRAIKNLTTRLFANRKRNESPLRHRPGMARCLPALNTA